MSKFDYDGKDFEPKLGFEKSIEESSLSFSEFEKNSIHSSEFLQASDPASVPPKENAEMSQDLNDSKGLNQGFYEEKSESISLGEPVKFIEDIEETTQIKLNPSNEPQKTTQNIENLVNNPTNFSQGLNQSPVKVIKRKTCCEKVCMLF